MVETLKVSCVDPVQYSQQKLYLGEKNFKKLKLRPGDVVHLDKYIATCFLYSIREITGLILETGVYTDSSEFCNLSSKHFLKSTIASNIKRLKPTSPKLISVQLLFDIKKNIEDIDTIRDILYNVYFINNSIVHLKHCPTSKLYSLQAIRIFSDECGAGQCFKVGKDTEIIIKESYTISYLTSMIRSMYAPPIAGVEKIYSRMMKCIKDRSQHILLCGPQGAGKSCITTRIAADLQYPLVTVECSELGVNTELLSQKISECLDIVDQNKQNLGVILFLKNIETAGGTKGIHQMQPILKIQQQLDKYLPKESNIIFIATTSKPESIHQNLRRPGRLGLELFMKVPSQEERVEMLECISKHSQLQLQKETLQDIAIATRGFLAADLSLLVTRIKMSTSDDEDRIQKCIDQTIPSGLRQGLGWVNLEKVSWDTIGGMEDVKQSLIRSIEWPIRKPEAFKRLGIKASKGVLLYGPPGCGKTRLVRAAASNTGATLLSVSGAEIYSPYVGDSEKAIVQLFRQARLGAPTILFIDEIDTIVCNREGSGTSTSPSHKVLSTLLTEMDGMGGKEQDSVASGQVLVVGATNRPSSLDSALTRPGRLDTLLYIPPPDHQTRVKILERYLQNVPHEDMDLELVAQRTDNFSGADLENIVKESVLHLLSTEGLDSTTLRMEHVLHVLKDYRSSLSGVQLQEYEEVQFR